jgi:hypothetical protein
MAKYKQYENLPWWLNNLNDNTLTPTQKEVLGLDYYCKRHGTKLSHRNAAALLDRSRRSIIYARNRLKDLGLRTTEPAKGSLLIGHPIEYQNEAEFWAQLRARSVSLTGAKFAPKSVQKKKPLQGFSSSQVQNEASAETAEAGEFLPQTPAGLTDRCSGEAGESPSARKAKDELLWKVTYRDSLSNLLDVGWPKERAERLARIKADKYLVQRKSDRKNH